MKKKRTIIKILLMTMIISLNIYNASFKRIKFSDKYLKDDDYKIIVGGTSASGIKVEDRDEKEKVIKHMNSTKYFYGFNLKPGGDSPNGCIVILDKHGKMVEDLTFFGEELMHCRADGNYCRTYWTSMDQRDKLKRLHNDLEKRSK
ncbi:hypothetical protein KPL28_13630 [Clostridium algidicarnis]|uniref:hypothetical protein n=1 Tax=Clostridium algidicarnis TaxID=37659 RepID=UPI001C0DBCEB|nr:hypothetical protein [Clostridium algidicarnis]MBU3210647.1 hypothetical protein [Clostridium algidicarnis]